MITSECVFFTAVFHSDQEICRAVTRPKECPRNQKDLCTDDSTCSSGLKCCNTGCRKECTRKFALLQSISHIISSNVIHTSCLLGLWLASHPAGKVGELEGVGLYAHSLFMPEKVTLHTYNEEPPDSSINWIGLRRNVQLKIWPAPQHILVQSCPLGIQ